MKKHSKAFQRGNRLISAVCSLVLAVGLLPMLAFADDEATPLQGGTAITTGGTYELSTTTTGTITVETSEPVVIVGQGIQKGAQASNVHFDCTAQPSDITLRDLFISNNDDTAPVFNFAYEDNALSFEGAVLVDNQGLGQGTYAAIHVAKGTSLTVRGSGTAYLYKHSGGAGIGGNKSEMNGDITFAMTGSLFGKGSKQGALIGAGAGASSSTDAPGFVQFESGVYNLISNSRGAVIGGAAGSTGGSTGTEVYLLGGSVNINVDYSGAAVGGGGYAQGNDASGGTIFITGGSLRVYVDKNAANNLAEGYNGEPIVEGINDAAITAARYNTNEERVYRCIVDTTGISADESGNYTLIADNSTFFTGPLHSWCFAQEAVDRNVDGAVAPSGITYTPDNWLPSVDHNLYVYLTGEDHAISVNGQNFEATWDEESSSFTVTRAGSVDLPGDANNNGVVNIVDAQIVYEMAAGVYTEEAQAALLACWGEGATIEMVKAVCDVNGGGLDATDAFAIQYYVHTGSFA